MHRTHDNHATDADPPTTLLESFDSWAQLLRNGEPSAAALAPATPGTAAGAPEAEPYRPILRRHLALLHVIDDGRDDGETIRLRSDSLLIGRTDGDVTIPHDITMSTRHALLEYGGDHWTLSDVGSAGGTFVRVLSARLHDGSCLQLGATRFRFDAVDEAEPCLVELRPEGDGTRHSCRGPLATIGRAGMGRDIGVADPFISPLHAEVKTSPGGWRIENRGLNGLWVRITSPIKLGHPAQFQCGEQRFVFVPLAS
jgi:pSer/pThr/pTyr-binding forkhead associated (FHA) protein